MMQSCNYHKECILCSRHCHGTEGTRKTKAGSLFSRCLQHSWRKRYKQTSTYSAAGLMTTTKRISEIWIFKQKIRPGRKASFKGGVPSDKS